MHCALWLVNTIILCNQYKQEATTFEIRCEKPGVFTSVIAHYVTKSIKYSLALLLNTQTSMTGWFIYINTMIPSW